MVGKRSGTTRAVLSKQPETHALARRSRGVVVAPSPSFGRRCVYGSRVTFPCLYRQNPSDSSDGSEKPIAGIFSRRTNQTQEVQAFSHDGPIVMGCYLASRCRAILFSASASTASTSMRPFSSIRSRMIHFASLLSSSSRSTPEAPASSSK
eukprot:2017739-Pyramimonas_sp.AAC.1